jgi:phosphoglycolate phosphatase
MGLPCCPSRHRVAQALNYQLLSFDLDGTLVDTAAEIAEAANRTLDTFGSTRRPVEEISRYIGFGLRPLMQKLWAGSVAERPELAQQVHEREVLEYVETQYARVAGSMSAPYAGCLELLTDLRAAGISLACVTNKEFRLARGVLQATELEGFFDLVIGGDSLGARKPDASVLRHVAGTLGADLQRTAHLGDSGIDVTAARNSGVEAWAVTYGYNGGVPIQMANPDRLFASLGEVRHFLFPDHSIAALT